LLIKEALKMERTIKALLIILLLIFSVVMGRCTIPQKPHSATVAKEVPEITKTMYLKSGRAIECDMLWEGAASQILCKKSGDIIAYSAGDVDLIRTFGQSSATEIAKKYEERVKHTELMSRPMIVTPEQERNMRERERERPKIDMPARLTRRDLEEMFKFAPTAAEARSRGVNVDAREEKIARYLRAQAIREHEAALERERERISREGRTGREEMAKAGPATSSIIESKVDGEFEGWDGDTVVKLINGQIWHQTDYHISVTIKIMPDVLIYRSGGQWKMKVEGTRKAVTVERLR
jgi:hypothetical protein